MDELKDKTAKGLLWGGLGNGAMQVIGLLLGLVMLNILSPADYGKIAVLLIYSNIATSLQDSGLTAALINKKEPTHEEYNSVFWFNILVSSLLYLLLVCGALHRRLQPRCEPHAIGAVPVLRLRHQLVRHGTAGISQRPSEGEAGQSHCTLLGYHV